MSTNGVLPLTEVRGQAAAALAPAGDDDPEVFVDVVDAVTPPAILLAWDDPWLEPQQNVAGCWHFANLAVLCVAGRLEPGPGIQTLEQMAGYVIERLRADDYNWPQASSQAPREFRIGDVPYLGARVIYRIPVTTQGGP